MSSDAIDPIVFRDELAAKFIELLDSQRGVAANLAKSIGKTSSFINEIRRGKPVNALHIKAVSIVFGTKTAVDMMSMDNIHSAPDVNFKNGGRGQIITTRLLELEKMSPKAFDLIDTYIAGVYEGAKATADMWDGIERRSKERRSSTEEDLGFESQKNGTDE
jgi:hypothetical protein